MISLPSGTRIWLVAGVTDMRKSFNGLGEQIQHVLDENPFSGHLFIFRELVARLKQHIPEKFFKMVRYFGFLANRVCGEKLPQVYRALGMDKPEPVAKVCYAQMMKQFLRRDPFECVLCGGRMVYRRAIAGLNVDGLKKNARDISLQRYVPA
ncbi:IS1294, transposase, truncation [Escherichia coli]|nr:IS1294, transposase, truncation [Escherichia coli]